jgi:hypothetical protein
VTSAYTGESKQLDKLRLGTSSGSTISRHYCFRAG